MTDVAFYHLRKTPLETVLAKLLERTLSEGRRALVLTGSEERAEALAVALWTYDPDSWLPHGTRRDGNPEDQPIWLSERDENANGAAFLFLTDGAQSQHLADYQRCFDLFDGNDEAAVTAARERWRNCKAAGHALSYWQQNENGRWERSA